MRVLVVASSPAWTPGTRLMATLAAGLSSRGDVVALACASRSESEQAIERTWPRLTVRAVSGTGWFRQGMSLKGIVTALRPDALLVGSVADAVLAAFALGKRGGIVRRIATEERGRQAHDDVLPWRARFALSRATITPWGDTALAVSWPVAGPAAVTEPIPADVHRLPVLPPHLVIVPAQPHDDRTANALRAAAHLRTRHPDLRITLAGNVAALQATRLHAASLDLTTCLDVEPLDVLLHHELPHASAVWVAEDGDAGAIAALAAMQQGVPVVVPQDCAFGELVAPAITGYTVPTDGGAAIVSDLARLLSDSEMRRSMGEAARARATRVFAWDAFVDTAATLLARASGVPASRVTRRPSLTPA